MAGGAGGGAEGGVTGGVAGGAAGGGGGVTGGYKSGLDALLDGRRLSPVQRRIAHYLSEHLDEAFFLSSVELAERSGVSQPSVTRFAMVMGFAGYPELRQALRPLVIGGSPAAPHETLLRSAIDAEIRN